MISITAICLAVALSAYSPLNLQDDQLDQDFADYKLGGLEITGSSPFDPEALRNASGIRSGDHFDPQRIKELLGGIQKLFFALGYIEFTYTPRISINRNEKTVACSFVLLKGRQYFVNQVKVYGIENNHSEKEIMSALSAAGLEGVASRARLDKTIKDLSDLFKIKHLNLCDYGFERSSKDGMVDIYVRFQAECHRSSEIVPFVLHDLKCVFA
jgi:hypothetical protein